MYGIARTLASAWGHQRHTLSDLLVCAGAARDLLAGTTLWSNLTSIMVGLAVMISFRLLGVNLLKSLPGG